MSHFTVYVFQDKDSPSIGEMLAPYDEGLELEKPVISMTKADAIAKCRKDIEYTNNGCYKEYLENPEEYEKKWGYNKNHINFLKNDFPKRLKWTDEECYEYEKSFYEKDMIDEEGNLLTTDNPNSKWDWYQLGGRYSGDIKTKNGLETDKTTVGDIDFDNTVTPYAFVTTGGEWVERGQMGWFGLSSNDKDEDDWDKQFRDYVKSLGSDVRMTLIDCHI